MSALPAPSPLPRWPTLLALIAAVVGVHLALLAGPVSWPSVGASLPASAPTKEARLAGQGETETASPAPPEQPMARVSTVRWIVPTPAAEPASAPVAPSRHVPPTRPPAPRPAARTEPAPPPAAETAHEAAPFAPVPKPDNAGSPTAETVAIADIAPIPPAPEPAPAHGTTANDEPAPAPESDLLAAASVKVQATTPAVAPALPPAQPPSSTQLDYAVTGRIKGIAYNADGQLNWTLSEGRYSARMEMKLLLLGSRVQTSTGTVGPQGLNPERFGDRSRSEKAAHFDTAQQRVRFSNNAPDAPLLPGAQDRLSMFLQIAGLLQARPAAYASGQTIELPVVGTGGADIWRFEVGDEVALALPAGEMRARQIRRLPRKEFDSTVEMWLAPGLQHLPVRLRVTQANGDVADQQLRRLP